MDKSDRNISLVALIIGVIAISVAFTAYSKTLSINLGTGLRPNEGTFKVGFSLLPDEIVVADIVPKKTPETLKATNAKITNSTSPTISGLHATFTEPGQSATYYFYIHNNGENTIFLNNITFINVPGTNAFKVCDAVNSDNSTSVEVACEGISLSVKVGAEKSVTSSVPSIANHSLLVNNSELVTVTISYNGPANFQNAFDVRFGDITLRYDSID